MPTSSMSIHSDIYWSRLLPADNIFIWPEALEKEQVITRLVEALCAGQEELDPQVVLAQVLRREREISTELDSGLAVPHARPETLANMCAALAVLPQGLAGAAEGRKIQTICLVLTPPRPEFFKPHLQLLAGLAARFTPGFIARLCTAKGRQEAASLIAADKKEML